MTIHLCMVVDDNYVDMAERCIHDIVIRQNLETKLRIVIIYDKMTDKAKRLMSLHSRRCELLFFRAESDTIPVPDPSGDMVYLSRAIYLKCIIPYVIKDVDRVLYVDCDMLCRRDLTELYTMDLHGKPLGVVKEYYPIFHDDPIGSEFNTGLMLMDLPKLRECKFTERCISATCKNKGDQELISEAMKDNCYYLPPACQVPIHIFAYQTQSKLTSHDIYTINEYFGSSYRSLDDLFDQAYFYHFFGNKEYWWKVPLVQLYKDIADKRLELYHLTYSFVKLTKKDDESVDVGFRLICNGLNEAKAKVLQAQHPVTIDWSKYFDRVYCIHYCGYNERFEETKKELARVGLLDNPVFQFMYTTRSPFDGYIREAIGAHGCDFSNARCDQVTNLVLTHYRIYQEALGQGFKHILILEDDIRFTNNFRLIQDTLDHMPEGYDYIHFDKVRSIYESWRLSTMQRGDYYYSNYTGGYFGGGCQAYSVKAMQRSVELLEQCLEHADFILEGRDDNKADDIARYAPIARIVYQDKLIPNYYMALI